MTEQWYWIQCGQKRGPIDTAGLKKLAGSGQLQPTDLIRSEGLSNWIPALNAKDIFPGETSFASDLPASKPDSPEPSILSEAGAAPFSPATTRSEEQPSETRSSGHETPSVPHPPRHTTEAIGATTWKCPTCAEEIQKDAQKCRFCGMVLTKAAKMGYPTFYKSAAENGLSCSSLLFDYADFLYPNDGWLDCCLSATNILGSFIDNPDDEHKTKLLERAGGIVKAMRERLKDIPAESQEALILRPISKYLWMIRDFARPGSGPLNDPESLQRYLSSFTELRKTLATIEPEDRRDLEQNIDFAIEACQDQLGKLGAAGTACNEPSLTVPPPVAETSALLPLPPPTPSEICCNDCKYRVPRNVCGKRESQFCGKTVDPKHSCPFFQVNTAQGYFTAALAGVVNEDQTPETTISLLEAAIKGGLPEDDEIFARRFLAPYYLDLAFKHMPGASVAGDPLFLEAPKHLEYAVKIDTEQGYGVFSDPLNRAILPRFDACYGMQSNVLKKTQGPDASIAYLEEKLAVFEGMPGDPMVTILLGLGVLCYERGDAQKARAYFQRVVDAKPIAQDKDDEEYYEKAKGKARKNLALLEEEKLGQKVTTFNEPFSPSTANLDEKITRSGGGPITHKGRALFDECVHTIKIFKAEMAATSSQERGILMKIIVNILFLIPYIVLLSGDARGELSGGTLLMLLLILFWGFIGFRWVLNSFTSVTGLVLFADLKSWGWIFFIGSFICSTCGGIIIPVLIVFQAIQLYRLRGINNPLGKLAVAIPILTVSALILSAVVHSANRGRPVANNREQQPTKTLVPGSSPIVPVPVVSVGTGVRPPSPPSKKAPRIREASSSDHKPIANIRAEAENGDAKSQYELGNAYFYGKLGMAKDYVEAVQWFRKSAEQNFAKAQMTLGVCYGVGYGVTKDDAQAMQWYRKAADQNFAAAQSTLSSRYERGEGVERDVVEAYKWILLAAGNGSSNAKRNLKAREDSLTPEQIAEGKHRADDWRKQHNF